MALAACGPAIEPQIPLEGLQGPAVEQATARAVRASIAIRGIRPSMTELTTVGLDPGAVDPLIDAWLADDARFGATVRRIHTNHWVLWSDYGKIPAAGTLAGVEAQAIRSSLFEAPVRIAERVVVEDRPYTEILTADWLMADEVLAAAWTGTDYPGDATGWREAHWVDGRPQAGILSDSMLWVIYRSCGTNYSRGRAATLANVLACYDFFVGDQPIESGVDLADPAAVSDAVLTDPACVACHGVLDGIASAIPFMDDFVIQRATFPEALYDPELTGDAWTTRTGRAPAWFGTPVSGLEELAEVIADDPRFVACTARRTAAWFSQRTIDEVPDDEVDALASAFAASGTSYRALVRSIVASEPFSTPPTDPDGRLLRLRPEELSLVLEDLTGFRWVEDIRDDCCGAVTGSSPTGPIDFLTDGHDGYRILLGGTDAPFVSLPTYPTSPTAVLAIRSAAARAAAFAIDAAYDDGETRLIDASVAGDGDEPAVRAALVALHLRLFGERVAADDAPIDATWALFADVLDRSADPRRAWTVLLAAMLQDARLVTY
ncbi:MAG: DUF1585 domain-containing protein [Myxococcota bacterium]